MRFTTFRACLHTLARKHNFFLCVLSCLLAFFTVKNVGFPQFLYSAFVLARAAAGAAEENLEIDPRSPSLMAFLFASHWALNPLFNLNRKAVRISAMRPPS